MCLVDTSLTMSDNRSLSITDLSDRSYDSRSTMRSYVDMCHES